MSKKINPINKNYVSRKALENSREVYLYLQDCRDER